MQFETKSLSYGYIEDRLESLSYILSRAVQI